MKISIHAEYLILIHLVAKNLIQGKVREGELISGLSHQNQEKKTL